MKVTFVNIGQGNDNPMSVDKKIPLLFVEKGSNYLSH